MNYVILFVAGVVVLVAFAAIAILFCKNKRQTAEQLGYDRGFSDAIDLAYTADIGQQELADRLKRLHKKAFNDGYKRALRDCENGGYLWVKTNGGQNGRCGT